MEKYVVEVLNIQNAKVRYQSHIHNDIAFSILSKLSIKSLKRFGCVCKSWSLLFDNHTFMTAYRKNFLSKVHPYYNDKSLLLHQNQIIYDPFGDYYKDKDTLYSVSDERLQNIVQLNWPKVILDRPNYNSGFDILNPGSVNGTLCLICENGKSLILWNPSTEEFKVIPPSPIDFRSFENYRGFGYDTLRNDFKVMRHFHVFFHVFQATIWEIYSVRSNSWKKLNVDMHHCPMRDFNLYIDGLSHCLCKTNRDTKAYLLSFDWSEETFLTTPLPYDLEEGIFNFSEENHLVLLNGSIALIIISYNQTDSFHILILEELGVRESWTKIFTVGPLHCFSRPIGVGKKGRILFEKIDGFLAWFDLNTQMIEDIDFFPEGSYNILFHKKNLLPIEG